MRKIVLDNLVRVSKNKAMKLFNNGITIQMVPCKANPKNFWFSDLNFNINNTLEKNFIKLVDDFIYYNCIQSYQKKYGLYSAYYVDVNEVGQCLK